MSDCSFNLIEQHIHIFNNLSKCRPGGCMPLSCMEDPVYWMWGFDVYYFNFLVKCPIIPRLQSVFYLSHSCRKIQNKSNMQDFCFCFFSYFYFWGFLSFSHWFEGMDSLSIPSEWGQGMLCSPHQQQETGAEMLAQIHVYIYPVWWLCLP